MGVTQVVKQREGDDGFEGFQPERRQLADGRREKLSAIPIAFPGVSNVCRAQVATHELDSGRHPGAVGTGSAADFQDARIA